MARARSKSKRGGSETKIKSRREVSAGGLIWRRRSDGSISVVLVRPAGRSTWVLPKGHLEEGETVAQAATREAREETGLTVGEIEPLGEISYVYSSRERNGAAVVALRLGAEDRLAPQKGEQSQAEGSEQTCPRPPENRPPEAGLPA